MTFRELIRVMVRRWYVLAATIVLATLLTTRFLSDATLFATHTKVVFTWPGSSILAADNGTRDADVIAFAGVIATDVSEGKTSWPYATNDAPLYGAGIRRAAVVHVPNAGGQWEISFPDGVVAIEIVGPSRQWVEAQQQSLVARIDQASVERQGASGTAPVDYVMVRVDPSTTDIHAIGPSPVAVAMALFAMVGAALIGGAAGSVLIDRARLFRGRPKLPEAQLSSGEAMPRRSRSVDG